MRSGAVAVAIAALATAGAASSARANHFVLERLVSDRADAQLVNAWGLAASATGPWWIANEARSSSTLYDRNGRKQALAVHVPGGPTGVVFYGGRGFVIRSGILSNNDMELKSPLHSEFNSRLLQSIPQSSGL